MKQKIKIFLFILLFLPFNSYAAEFKKNNEGTTTVNEVIENTQRDLITFIQ